MKKKRVGQFHAEVTNYSWRDTISGIKLLGEGGKFIKELISCSRKDLTCIKLPGKVAKTKREGGSFIDNSLFIPAKILVENNSIGLDNVFESIAIFYLELQQNILGQLSSMTHIF